MELAWLPMPPNLGPPLPRSMQVYWPWVKAPTVAPVYACPYCSAEFATQGELYEHIRTAHAGQPPAVVYVCPVCGFRFSSLTELQEHYSRAHVAVPVAPTPEAPVVPTPEAPVVPTPEAPAPAAPVPAVPKLSIPRFNYVYEGKELRILGSTLEPMSTASVSHLGFTLSNDGGSPVAVSVKGYCWTGYGPWREMTVYAGALDQTLSPIGQPFSLAPGTTKVILYQVRTWRTYGGGFWEHFLGGGSPFAVRAEVYVNGQLVLAKEQAFQIAPQPEPEVPIPQVPSF